MARCTPGACGAAPGGRANFAMAIREGAPVSVSIKFSNDSLHWTAPLPLKGFAAYSSYGQAPGLIALTWWQGQCFSWWQGAARQHCYRARGWQRLRFVHEHGRAQLEAVAPRVAVPDGVHHDGRDRGRHERWRQDLRAHQRVGRNHGVGPNAGVLQLHRVGIPSAVAGEGTNSERQLALGNVVAIMR